MGSWLPLESNPDVLNPFAKRLGLPGEWQFTDVFGLDEELLMMVPQPCAALCLLYPSSKINAVRRPALAAAAPNQPTPPPSLFFVQQCNGIGNACGTIACMHAVANAASSGAFSLESGSALKTYLDRALPLGPKERGELLLTATDLQELSDATAASGETEGAGTDDAQGQHFIAFVTCDGMLYELDGRNFDHSSDAAVAMPVCHGATSAETFLSDAAKVIREEFMARDPESINFNITALCKQGD